MGWPEVRAGVEAHIAALRREYTAWNQRRFQLATARNAAEQVLAGALSRAPREALTHIHLAHERGQHVGTLLTRAIDSCYTYLSAVDPDNAAGATADLPAPRPHGSSHGGHGGPDVPAARTPLTGNWRRRSHVFTEQGPGGLADLLARGGDLIARHGAWLRAGGHALDRHGAAVTDAQLRERAAHGHDPITGTRTDWEHGGDHGYGALATAFTTDSALAYAEMRIHDSRENQMTRASIADNEFRYPISVSAAAVFGPNFRQHLRGCVRVGTKKHPQGVRAAEFPDDTQVRAVYTRDTPSQDWVLHTCYPTFTVHHGNG